MENEKGTPKDGQLKKELPKILLSALLYAAYGGYSQADSALVTGFVGRKLGTNALAAYSIVGSMTLYLGYVFAIVISGVTSRIAAEEGEKQYHHIGKRIQFAILASFVWSGTIIGLLLGIQNPLYQLYEATPAVIELARPLLVFKLTSTPLFVLFMTMLGILSGFSQIFLLILCNVLSTSLDLLTSYLFLVVFNLPLWSLGIVSIISNAFNVTLMSISVFRPSNWKKYGFAQNPFKFEKSLFTGFLSDSLFLLGKGMLLIVPYLLAPVISSRFGTVQIAAYSILISLLLYPVFISECVGIVCNFTAARLLGEHRYQDLRHLFWIMPLFCIVVISIPGTLVFLFFKEKIIHAFTTDPLVIKELEPLWWLLVMMQSFAGIIGTAEGFVTATKYFKVLFGAMLASMFVYLPLTLTDMFRERTMSVVVLAYCIFIGFRAILIVFVWTWVNWQMKKKQTEERMPLMGSVQ